MAHDSKSPPSTRRLRTVSIVVAVFALVVVAYGLVSRAAQNSHLHELTEARAVPNVAVVNPSTARNGSGLERMRNLKPDDVVELEVEKIGILRTRVTRP